MDEEPFLVVGLGNPGSKYVGNRHNVGQMVLDVVARRADLRFRRHRARAVVAEGRLGMLSGGRPGPRVVLAKPSSYMNLSGGPVAGLLRYLRIPPERLVVVHDELDIPMGQIRLKGGGGEGGHNGLRDITKALGTRQYLRVRIGVGRPGGKMDAADYVLQNFPAAQAADLAVLLDDGADAVEVLIAEGLLAAQGAFHARPGGSSPGA